MQWSDTRILHSASCKVGESSRLIAFTFSSGRCEQRPFSEAKKEYRSAASLELMIIVPLFERLVPIIEAPPEIDEAKKHPGELTGEIEVSHLAFRYTKDGPPILKDVSLNQCGQNLCPDQWRDGAARDLRAIDQLTRPLRRSRQKATGVARQSHKAKRL